MQGLPLGPFSLRCALPIHSPYSAPLPAAKKGKKGVWWTLGKLSWEDPSRLTRRLDLASLAAMGYPSLTPRFMHTSLPPRDEGLVRSSRKQLVEFHLGPSSDSLWQVSSVLTHMSTHLVP